MSSRRIISKSIFAAISVLFLISTLVLAISLVWTILNTRAFYLPDFRVATQAAWSFLLFCIAVAGLTMTLIQTCRTLIPVRGLFHRRALKQMLAQPYNENPKDWPFPFLETADPSKLGDEALGEFEQSSGPTPLFPSVPLLYDLSIEQLCGQLTVAAESALDQPTEFRHLLLGLVGSGGKRDVQPLLFSAASSLEQGQARGTLSRIIQRRLDKFQIEAGGEWRLRLRSVAVAVCIIFSWLITLARLPDDASLAAILYMQALREYLQDSFLCS